MLRVLILSFSVFLAILAVPPAVAEDGVPPAQVVISVADQKMALLREGGLVARYPVSTSKFGVGDGAGSYKTPLGRMRVCDKVGDNYLTGSVIKHRQATGEVLPVNAPGRDPIVTRILWLDGCESQNANARSRSIYIHGTTEEKNIGKPVSWGCVRMRSQDVIALYEELPVGATVTVIAEKLPRFPKYVPRPSPGTPPEIIIATAKKEKEQPAPVAEREAPKLVASATHSVTVAPLKERAMEATVARRGTNLEHAMGSSILLSGLGDGNSEIPHLRP